MRILLLLVLASASVLAQTPSPKPAAPELRTGATVRGKYITLNVGTNESDVAPGGTITLIVRATPGRKMHVYAPGQQGYTPVALTVEKKDATYRARAVTYPKPTLFEFTPLNEKVQVYDAPFTLMQAITLATTPALRQRASTGGTLAISGTFAYQACDDTICYRPETLAVEWRIKLVPSGRQLHTKGQSK